jgi:GAF domain-containing protein
MPETAAIHLLVVDDNRAFCDAIQERLGEDPEARYGVVTTRSATEARAALQAAQAPFDVLLIDQKLRAGEDGIQLMTELLGVSPDSTAIVLTGFASREDGLRALRAGAYHYVQKSADWPALFEELILQMSLLVESRKTRRETEWLRVLTENVRQFQSCLNREDVAVAVIDGALRLGFRQARLWQVFSEGRYTWLKGWKQLPPEHLPGFEGFRMRSTDSPYNQRVLAGRQPHAFNGRELGPSPLDGLYPDPTLPDQEGLWVDVPLWRGDRCLAKLSLFHYEHPRPLDQTALSVVQLYADQAAAAFHRVELYEQNEIRQQLAEINELPNPRTERELDELLGLIYQQAARFFNTANFFICLVDEETREMNFRLRYEGGAQLPAERRTLMRSAGLVAHVFYSHTTQRLSHGTERFCRRHQLRRYGPPARSWLGVPIRYEGKILGVMAVQDHERDLAYTKADEQLLEAIGDQAASALGNAYLSLQANRAAQQLEALQYISGEVLKFAPADLNRTLHVVLTAVTASYGLAMNRAMLFLVDAPARKLRGQLGIGYLKEAEARQAWEEDERAGMNFQTYLNQLVAGKLARTPLQALIPKLSLPLDDAQSAFSEVVRSRQPQLLEIKSEARRLPKAFRDAVHPTKELALVPLKAGDKVIGVLAVDNKFNKRPIDPGTLDHLQTFVNQAALAVESSLSQRAEDRRRRQELEAWNQIQQAIIDIGSEADLNRVLESVAKQARWALPSVDAITLYYVDRETNALQLGGSDGINDPGRIESGADIAESVVARVLQLDEPRFASHVRSDALLDGTFVAREHIQSAAAFPLRYSNEQIGCMFFNYRSPHEFEDSDQRELRLFAQQATLAIRNALLHSEAERRRRRFETVARITPVISAALDPDEVVRAILRETLQAVRRARQACMLHYEAATDDLIFSPVSKEFYRIDVPGEERRERVSPAEGSIARRVVRSRVAANVPDVRADRDSLALISTTRSELCVPIQTQDELLGVLVLESDQLAAFSNEDQQLLEALADQAVVALKKAQEHSELRRTKENLAANSALAWVGIYGSNLVHTVIQYTYPIEGKLFLLRQNLAPLSDSVERWLNEIQETVNEIKQLTDLTQKLAKKPQNGRHATEIDRALSAEVARWCKRHPDIVCELDLHCAGVRVAIDKDDLEIPLEKLVNNAIKAMAGKGRLAIRSWQHGGFVEVQVQDTGAGLDDVVQKYLFQEPVPRGPGQPGTGFGLLLARKIITDYGGDLKLLSTAPETGTTFSFQLPVAESEAQGA